MLALSGVLLLPACGAAQDETGEAGPPASVSAPTRTAAQSSDAVAPFTFDAPTASVPLAAELKEISGLTILGDGRVGAVQDEAGVVYVLDAASGAIQQKISFGEGADYEGIELAGDRLFVLRSNGDVDEIGGWQAGTPEVRTFETHLKGKNDTEGLAYDAASNRLLVVTKEDAGEGMGKNLKAIYGFDLGSGTLAEQPVYTIDLDGLSGRITGDGEFKPSAVAVRPSTGEIYVLSSVAKAIAVLDGNGAVSAVWNLPESIYEQPEGLAFLPDGGLLIASEGVERPATLHRLSPR